MGYRHVLVYCLSELDNQCEKHTADGSCNWNFAGATAEKTPTKSHTAIQSLSRYPIMRVWCCLTLAGSRRQRISELCANRGLARASENRQRKQRVVLGTCGLSILHAIAWRSSV